MKSVKKILFLFLFLLCFCLLPVKSSAAGLSASDSTGKGKITVNSQVNDDVYGMSYSKLKATASTNGNQSINVMSMKVDGFASKLVTWAIQDTVNTYTRASVAKIGEDYEKNHPGWIVVGGINADQYYFNYGNKRGEDGSAYMINQTYYPLVMDGEKRFTTSVYGSAANCVGFLNNGAKDGLVESTGAGTYVMKVYDDTNKLVGTYPIAGINQGASDNETSVWSVYNDQSTIKGIAKVEATTTGKMFVVENSELAYMSDSTSYIYSNSQNGQNAFFGRGSISSISQLISLKNAGEFAVETKNSEVEKALAVGTKIVVEHNFSTDEMNEVESATGYHSAHILNGIDQSSDSSYNTRNYSRSLFGQSKDGTYYLMTADLAPVDGVQCKGLNFFETNALGHLYNMNDFYQDDGGGSVTAVKRNASGKLEVVNVPKDSGNPNSPRSVYSGLFFVVRDPGVKLDSMDYQSVTLRKTELTKGDATISNIKVTLGDETKPFVDETIVFNGLTEDTDYLLNLVYDVTIQGVTKSEAFKMNFKTGLFIFPDIGLKVKEVGPNSFVFERDKTVENIQDIILNIGGNNFNMGSAYEFTCDNLIKDTSYTINCKFSVLDPVTNKVFTKELTPFIQSTLSYTLPTIAEFTLYKKEDTSIVFKYKLTDIDSVVKKIYIVVNDKSYNSEEISNYGKITISDLDFTKSDLSFVLHIEYGVEEDIKTLLSEEIVVEKTIVDEPVIPTPEKKGCKKSSMNFVYLFSATVLLIGLLKKKEN